MNTEPTPRELLGGNLHDTRLSNARQTDTKRERFRYAIGRHWCQYGQKSWTSEQMENAVYAAMRIRCRTDSPADGPHRQLDLIDHGGSNGMPAAVLVGSKVDDAGCVLREVTQ